MKNSPVFISKVLMFVSCLLRIIEKVYFSKIELTLGSSRPIGTLEGILENLASLRRALHLHFLCLLFSPPGEARKGSSLSPCHSVGTRWGHICSELRMFPSRGLALNFQHPRLCMAASLTFTLLGLACVRYSVKAG